MNQNLAQQGISTLMNHYTECLSPSLAHIAPIYQTATFIFPDVSTGVATKSGEEEGFVYTRLGNPNEQQLSRKYALLEGLDLLKMHPDVEPEEVVTGRVFGSGMAAISSAVLAIAKTGDTVIVQRSLYGNTFNFFDEIAPRSGIHVVWVKDTSLNGWHSALERHPEAVLVYAETPVNPTMLVVDLRMLSEMAHKHGCWLVVDNTFATPYCQRPLSLGADVVLHSTTKYLSGHGVIIGGAVVSPHLDYIQEDLQTQIVLQGGVPSPFDSWLANLGLRTFELRMERHCKNALMVAKYLSSHSRVASVYYPGLESDEGYPVARKQMDCFGGMLSFELSDGYQAGVELMERLQLMTLAVSLGNVDTLIQHPASMTHSSVPQQDRLEMGITDGLVRLSVGIENVEDILADLEQGLKEV